jgi:DNA polymerase elongation subunit (family B)
VTAAGPHYIALAQTTQKTLLPSILLLGDVGIYRKRYCSFACAVIVTLILFTVP